MKNALTAIVLVAGAAGAGVAAWRLRSADADRAAWREAADPVD
ncbi:DLW-39 family protein [Kocuria sp. p3-SID1433]|nr:MULTISPECIES: DLW-39 family protein [unclassified Kocuria]MCT1600924.1 DLW-39 family protein [Kocuria sp. p3-SID1428]MCT2179115.1 DLW-39 family protein [Kocuria sp. p3-SID1433]